MNRQRTNKRILIAFGVVFLLIAIIALIPSDEADAPTPAVAAESTPTSSAEPEETRVKFDRPTPSERLDLVGRLLTIDPRIAENDERYARRAVDTCQMLTDNEWSEGKFVDTTTTRFRGGTLPDFSDAQAKEVIAAVRDTFCEKG